MITVLSICLATYLKFDLGFLPLFLTVIQDLVIIGRINK